MPLQDELARPERLRGGLRGELADGLGLAELPGEVARARGAQDGGGGVEVREAGGGGLEGLVRGQGFVGGGERFVQGRAAGQEGPRRRRRGRDDGMVGLEGHPAARDVLGGEADGRQGVCELNGGWYQNLESRGRRGALGRRRWDVIGSRGVARRGGVVAAAVILTAAAAELPGHEGQLLVLVEAHLQQDDQTQKQPTQIKWVCCWDLTVYTQARSKRTS